MDYNVYKHNAKEEEFIELMNHVAQNVVVEHDFIEKNYNHDLLDHPLKQENVEQNDVKQLELQGIGNIQSNQLQLKQFHKKDMINKNHKVELAQELLRHERRSKDSQEMQKVKEYVAYVEAFIDVNKDKTLTPEIIQTMRTSYSLAIASCEYYESHRNPYTKAGQKRMQLVQDMHTSLNFEMSLLEIALTRYDMQNVTIGEFLELPMSQHQNTEKKEDTQEIESQNLTLIKPEEATEEAKAIIKLLEMPNALALKLVKQTKDKNGRIKGDSPYLRLQEMLHEFPASKTYAKIIDFDGKKIELLQKSDNSLYVIHNNQQIPLQWNVDRLSNHIDVNIMKNPEVYGSYHIISRLDKMRPGNDTLDNSEQQSRVRDICVHYLEKSSGVHASEFSNMSADQVWALSLQFAQQDKLSKEVAYEKLKAHIENFKNELLINGQETLEVLKKSQKEKNKETVVIHKVQEDKKEQEAEQEKWTEDEEKLKELVSDLIFAKDTWTTDETQEKPGVRMQKVLIKHVDIISILIVEQIGTNQEETGILETMMDKLPINLFHESEDSAAAMKNQVRKMLHEIRTFMDEVSQEKSEEKDDQEVGFVPLKNKMIHHVVQDVKKNPKVISNILHNYLNNISTEKQSIGTGGKTIFDKFVELEEKVDEYTEEALHGVQKEISEATKLVFGSEEKEVIELTQTKEQTQEEEKNKSEEETKREREKKRIEAGKKELDKIIEDSVKGNSGQGKFIKLVMNHYFGTVSTMDKRSMLASAFRNAKPVKRSIDPNAAKEEAMGNYMGGLFKGAGPLLQKMLQGLPTEGLPKSIKEAVEDMKSNLAPIPEEIVKAQLHDMVRRSNGTVTKIEVEKSLGAASVGQAFLCKLYGPSLGEDGKEVVIKLLRPDARNRMMREKEVVLSCAKKTDETGGMYHTYQGQLSRIVEELDLTKEASNCEQGDVYDNEEGHVHSVKVNKLIDPTINTLVLEKAPGTTVDRYIKDVKGVLEKAKETFYEKKDDTMSVIINRNNISAYNKTIKELMDEIARMDKRHRYLGLIANQWVTEGIFDKGYYHGDLHAGNMMIDDSGLTVIDFGNATQLSSKQQKEITCMMLAASGGDVDEYLRGFHNLLENTPEEYYKNNKDKLREVFQEVFSLGDETVTGQRIAVSLMKAQELGFELPASISNFSSSQLRLQNTMDDMRKLRKELYNTARDFIRYTMDKNMMNSLEGKDNYILFNPCMISYKHSLDTINAMEDKRTELGREEFFEKPMAKKVDIHVKSLKINLNDFNSIWKEKVTQDWLQLNKLKKEERDNKIEEIINKYNAKFELYKKNYDVEALKKELRNCMNIDNLAAFKSSLNYFTGLHADPLIYQYHKLKEDEKNSTMSEEERKKLVEDVYSIYKERNQVFPASSALQSYVGFIECFVDAEKMLPDGLKEAYDQFREEEKKDATSYEMLKKKYEFTMLYAKYIIQQVNEQGEFNEGKFDADCVRLVKEITQRESKSFLDVMGDVIMANKKRAIGNLGVMNSIKALWRQKDA